MDINSKLETKIVNEVFKQLLKEDPDLINNLTKNVKEIFTSINIINGIKNKLEEAILTAFGNQMEEIQENIEVSIRDNMYFDSIIESVVDEHIRPQLEVLIVEKIKTISFK